MKAKNYCSFHMISSGKLNSGLIKENPEMQLLPSRGGFEYGALLYEEYDTAIDLCETARHFGWDGDWETMIARNELERDAR